VSFQNQPHRTVADLDARGLLACYRTMLLARALDEREVQLKRQNRTFFQISGAGHEAVQVAAGQVLRAGQDWFFPYYRDRALVLALGLSPRAMLLAAVGAAQDPGSGGRQMPSHWSDRDLNIASQSSPTGTQFLQAAGVAEAAGHLAHTPSRAGYAELTWNEDEVVYCSGGEGSTSEGEFWESLNLACGLRLPVLYLIEDNEYAISVPVEHQTAGGSISRLLAGFPHLLVREVDGCDLAASLEVLGEAVDWCRARLGPALVHAHVVRLHAHSLSDDQALYRTSAEREAEVRRDPLTRLAEWLVASGHAAPGDLERVAREVEQEVERATASALEALPPEPAAATRHVYAERVDPTASPVRTEPLLEGAPRTMVDLLNSCLRDEMTRDPRILVFGQDVADCSREENLAEVKGKGGVFKVTYGLQREFGSRRVFNTPLAEAAIVGRAIGLALRGLKPVVEIQFMDYIWPAYMQIRNELAAMRWRSLGAFACPVVVRVAYGGYLHGGAIYHSQSAEVLFTHIPGLRVVVPANAVDAAGLLRTALRCDDPVLFLEHKHLYRQTYNRGPYPGPDFTVPFGQAAVARAGRDATVVTFGALVQRALQAARSLEAQGIDIEVLDLRSLAPYDWETVAESVRRTSRALVLHEDSRSWGYGAEIAARISDELFDSLDAPVRRLAGLDTFVGYSPVLEEAILPQASQIVEAVRDLILY
jgi:2-oxoisovalerate dehydrogenase E1 component